MNDGSTINEEKENVCENYCKIAKITKLFRGPNYVVMLTEFLFHGRLEKSPVQIFPRHVTVANVMKRKIL